MSRGLALSALSGFLALSHEILWYRAYSFATASAAPTFGLMLGAYLAGLALGAAAIGDLSRRQGASVSVRLLAISLSVSNVGSFLLVPGLARALEGGWEVEWTLPFVGLVAAGMGMFFPLVCHVCIPADGRSGTNLSYFYLANILGSTGGSLLTGFVLLDLWPLRGIAALLYAAGFALVLTLIAGAGPVARVAVVVVAIGGLAAGPRLYDRLYERLQLKDDCPADYRFDHVMESRSGVVTVDSERRIYGHGIYDGAFNVSLRDRINTPSRPYFVEAVRPGARDLLVIGLSSGSWALILADLPATERVTVVEINPGYLKLVERYPQTARILRHPKVKIEIDDGRRWLLRNRAARFDAVVANATFHWRAGATNLLSAEFLALVKSRLNPGGLYFYNATSSDRVFRTGALAFRHALQVMGFLMVSDEPIEPDVAAWRRLLAGKILDGRPQFDVSLEADRKILDEVVEELERGLVRKDALLARTERARLITDDNLGTEFLPR
jgi:predicted membrane-bound spermidine synthase